MAEDVKDPKDMTDAELSASIENTVRLFLKEEGGAENALELPVEAPLWAEFDSLLVMELLVHLEGKYGVQLNTGKISPEDLKTIARIRDIATKAIRAAQK